MTILDQRIIHKDNIEFVTEFPCLLGHPVDLLDSTFSFLIKLNLVPDNLKKIKSRPCR